MHLRCEPGLVATLYLAEHECATRAVSEWLHPRSVTVAEGRLKRSLGELAWA